MNNTNNVNPIFNVSRELNEILIRRKNLIILPATTPSKGVGHNSSSIIGSILRNIEPYGFTFSPSVINELKEYSPETLIDWFTQVVEPVMKKITGANHKWSCMYPNFPQQVMDASEAELYINALVHYLTFGEVLPDYEAKTRLHLICNPNATKVIDIGCDEAAILIFKNIVSSNVSVSVQDINDCKVIFNRFPEICTVYLETDSTVIPNKENLAKITSMVWDSVGYEKCSMKRYFKTATDVLRLYVALSDGDVSLSSPTRFINLSRKFRRNIMNLLESCGKNLTEDMFRYREQWLRVVEKIHPFSYNNKKYNHTIAAFDFIRNKKKPSFFANKVNNLIDVLKTNNCVTPPTINNLVNILETRPGEFARKLDLVLRCCYNEPMATRVVLNSFESVANKISIPILLQLRKHFANRNYIDDRVFFPKGNVAKAVVIDNNLPHLRTDVCISVNTICNEAIKNKLKEKEPLGKVYIDEEFDNFIMPFSLRNANPASKIVTRGSRLKVSDDTNIIRLFVWWTNIDNSDESPLRYRVDLDLSCGFYDENWHLVKRISYRNLRDGQINCYHSGDITNGGPKNGNGVAEFIDIDLNSIESAKYAAFTVNSFTGQKFSELPNCCFGWMQRNGFNDGEIFEPATVDMKIDIKSASKVSIPAVFDCESREIIWTDINVSPDKIKPITIEDNSSRITKAINAIININKPTLYDLVYFNATARGEIVENKYEADIVFSNDTTEVPIFDNEGVLIDYATIVTAYDIDYFIGSMM